MVKFLSQLKLYKIYLVEKLSIDPILYRYFNWSLFMFDGQASVILEQSQLSEEIISRKIIGGRIKRILDMIIAIIAFIIFIPLFVAIPFLIRLSDDGPILFRQTRIGYGGRSFTCLKFRSMVPDANRVLKTLLATDPAARREWEENQKLIDDPRITALGKLLRKSSLDELPQLVNVIMGDMSLVGPRPIVAAEMWRYGDKLGYYLQARPGITGLWQVSGRNDCGYDQRIRMDADYVRNWRLSRDIIILLKTIFVVIKQKGSY